jgi:hypothetical protein
MSLLDPHISVSWRRIARNRVMFIHQDNAHTSFVFWHQNALMTGYCLFSRVSRQTPYLGKQRPAALSDAQIAAGGGSVDRALVERSAELEAALEAALEQGDLVG